MKDKKAHTLLENYIATLFMEFYEQVKHGDKEHKKWLKDETIKFIDKRVYGK